MVQGLRQAPVSCGFCYSKSGRVSLQPDDVHLMMSAVSAAPAGEFLGRIMPECDSVLSASSPGRVFLILLAGRPGKTLAGNLARPRGGYPRIP
jgi:hypothetical protein